MSQHVTIAPQLTQVRAIFFEQRYIIWVDLEAPLEPRQSGKKPELVTHGSSAQFNCANIGWVQCECFFKRGIGPTQIGNDIAQPCMLRPKPIILRGKCQAFSQSLFCSNGIAAIHINAPQYAVGIWQPRIRDGLLRQRLFSIGIFASEPQGVAQQMAVRSFRSAKLDGFVDMFACGDRIKEFKCDFGQLQMRFNPFWFGGDRIEQFDFGGAQILLFDIGLGSIKRFARIAVNRGVSHPTQQGNGQQASTE